MSFARGAFIQLNVIHALVLRETRTRFGEHQLGYLWALIEPLLWIGSFWGLYAFGHRPAPHNLEVVGFLATGVLTYEIFDSNVSRIGEAINGNKPLLFYPPVQPLDLVIARASLETGTLTAVFCAIMGGTALLRGEMPHIDSLLRVMLASLSRPVWGPRSASFSACWADFPMWWTACVGLSCVPCSGSPHCSTRSTTCPLTRGS